MLGSGITAVTAAFAPRHGARGSAVDLARGPTKALLDVPAAEPATASADARSAGGLTQPVLGPEAARGLALSQTMGAASPGGLSVDERDVVRQMATRDREVHQHEQAHARAGGFQAGSPSFSYQTGPDGKRYAVSGEVPIDTAPVPNDPKATIAKMAVVISAALAPASPSMPDRRIAAQAESTRLAALAELAAGRSGGTGGETKDEPELTGRLFTHLGHPEPGGELSRAV